MNDQDVRELNFFMSMYVYIWYEIWEFTDNH